MSETIIYKTKEEIELIRKSSLLVSKTLAEVAKMLKAGITTAEVNKVVDQYISDHGGYPIFKGYQVGANIYPAAACISVNEEVVHGLPGSRVLKSGDIVSVDCGVLMNEFVGDSAYTFAIGEVSADVAKLLKVTKQSLLEGVNMAKVNNRVGDISWAVQQYCEKEGFGVVTELVGHGLGRDLHEEPQIPNYGRRGSGKKLLDGLVIAIEPMINLGTKDLDILADGWTYATRDKKPSAHFEHTLAVLKEGTEILSSFEEIEAVEKANKNLSYCH